MARLDGILRVLIFSTIVSLLAGVLPSYATPPLVIGRIEGRVYSSDRSPLSDANVELINDYESLLARTKTGSDGRFTFIGLKGGNYKVRVLPFGTTLLEQTQYAEITSTRRTSDQVFLEFYLREKKTIDDTWQAVPAEAVFVQEIPKSAKDLYTSGNKALKSNEKDGVAQLEAALKEFPIYYDALISIGHYYITKNNFDKAYPYLLRAVDVNSRSFVGYYLSAYSFYKMNQLAAAAAAAKAACTINNTDYAALVLNGTILRLNGNYKDAEATLLKAKALDRKNRPDHHWQLSLTYNRMAKLKESADELEEYLKRTPNNPDEKRIRDTIDRLRARSKTAVNPKQEFTGSYKAPVMTVKY